MVDFLKSGCPSIVNFMVKTKDTQGKISSNDFYEILFMVTTAILTTIFMK